MRARFLALTSGARDEELALDVLRFDHGLDVDVWDHDAAPEDSAVDVYVMIANRWVKDELSAAAIRQARRTVVGLIFPDKVPMRPRLTVTDGNDIVRVARRAVGRAWWA